MNTATMALDAAPTCTRSLALLSGAFALFNALRIVAYLPTLAALQASGHADQHSLLSWLTFMCANATMALWLYEQNGRRMNSAIAFNAFNALMCGAVSASISWLRLTQPTSGFLIFF